jgi:hypothetical protein
MRLIEDPAAGSLDKRKHISPKLFYTRDEIIRLSILLRKVDTSVIRSDLLTKLKFGAGLVSGRDSLLGITLEMSQQIPTSPTSTALAVVPTVAALPVVTPEPSSTCAQPTVLMIRRSSPVAHGRDPTLGPPTPDPTPSDTPPSGTPSSAGTMASDDSEPSNASSNFTGTTDTLLHDPIQVMQYPPILHSGYRDPFQLPPVSCEFPGWRLPRLPPPLHFADPYRDGHPVVEVLAHHLDELLDASRVMPYHITPCDNPAFLNPKLEYSNCFSNPRYPRNRDYGRHNPLTASIEHEDSVRARQ